MERDRKEEIMDYDGRGRQKSSGRFTRLLMQFRSSQYLAAPI